MLGYYPINIEHTTYFVNRSRGSGVWAVSPFVYIHVLRVHVSVFITHTHKYELHEYQIAPLFYFQCVSRESM